MADVELLLKILRDIAAQRRNATGDFWSLHYCADAATRIEQLQAENARLRAEVEDRSRRHAETERDACQLASRLDASEKRAERLAEALRKLSADLRTLAGGETPDGDGVPVNVILWAEKRLAAIAAANGGNDASA